MAEKLVPTVRTTPSAFQFSSALLAVWPEATKAQAGVLWAHFAGETTDGVHCWNHNLGNVKHVAGDGYDYVSLRGVWEGFTLKDEDGDGDVDADDKTILVERLLRSGMWELDPSADHAKAVGPRKVSMIASPQNSATWFRAYPSLEIGMARFVDMKRNPQGRYFSSWAHVLLGDPEGYARVLGAKGYYTADPNVYAASMRKKFDAWMKLDAFDRALDQLVGIGPMSESTPVVSTAITTPAVIPDDAELVPVDCDGVTWLVAPLYVAPIGIGQAAELAAALGYELPTPALVDAIWRAADLKVPPHRMLRAHDGVHMNTPELAAEQAEAIAAFLAERGIQGLGRDYRLLAGAFKDVVRDPATGKVGLYGWHVDLNDPEAAAGIRKSGVPIHETATLGPGSVIQRPFYGHVLSWADYSQGVRFVRRA